MQTHLRNCFWLVCLFLAACGRIGSDEDKQTLAASAHIGNVEQSAGATPFISKVSLALRHYDDLVAVSYTIAAKSGTWSRPVQVTFDKAWLDRRNAYSTGAKRLALDVFGLYANHRNQVSITARFRDGSIHTERVFIDTPAFTGRAALYGSPDVKVARRANADPGFDYLYVQNGMTTPVVLDTDGQIRWIGTGVGHSVSAVFADNLFYVGNPTAPSMTRVELGGTSSTVMVQSPTYTNFHHELARGKTGLLAEVDAVENGVNKVESILAEISPTGEVLKEWNLAEIFRKHMRAGGDDPANFVRDGADWFHMNSAIYNPADNSLLLSSRENFVVKIDYDTGEIKWLLGDPTKYWYVDYPSLRKVAIKLTAGNVPIGQHSLSVLENGDLLLFNNGLASLNQPLGKPPGRNRSTSLASRYRIDEKALTGVETWSYDHGAIYADICSSVYQPKPDNYLIAYSSGAARTRARLVGVNAAGTIAFDFEYPTNLCETVFIARPIAFEALHLK